MMMMMMVMALVEMVKLLFIGSYDEGYGSYSNGDDYCGDGNVFVEMLLRMVVVVVIGSVIMVVITVGMNTVGNSVLVVVFEASDSHVTVVLVLPFLLVNIVNFLILFSVFTVCIFDMMQLIISALHIYDKWKIVIEVIVVIFRYVGR